MQYFLYGKIVYLGNKLFFGKIIARNFGKTLTFVNFESFYFCTLHKSFRILKVHEGISI